jgi:protein kinase-like protein
LAPGVVLGGKYRLDRPIGKGGMGEVWRARRLDLDADVAIKVMHLGSAGDETAFARFQREARAAAGLRSPHVVQIFDFGRDEATGVPFIAMELLEGESLRERLARDKVLPAAVVCEIVVQIGRALSRAHAAQIVHRDLKPDNVFLVSHDDQVLVKLLDFGIAKSEPRPGEGLPTATGVLLGTPYYMSPEQLQSSRTVDARTDLWSLCVIAYESLTGVKPFKAATLPELAMKIALGRSERPSRVAAVPLGFDEWFARGIAVEPERRYQSASELIEALRVVARETRQVGGFASMVVAPAAEAIAGDSLSSQVSSARGAIAAPASGDGQAAPRRPRIAMYVAAALAVLVAGLAGREVLRSSDAAAPAGTAGAALSPAVVEPVSQPAATPPVAPMPLTEPVPSPAPSAVVAPGNEASAEPAKPSERRPKSAKRKPAEPSAAPPARGLDAFDQQ